MDFYEVLSLKRDATDAQIKAAYRKLAMKYHPDRNPGDKTAETKFLEITEAYETLSSKERREAYDNPPTHAPFSGSGFAGTGFHFSHGFGGGGVDVDFDDLIRQFHVRTAPRNRDLTVNYNITLEQAFAGAVTNIRFVAPDGRPRDIMINIPAGVDTGHRVKLDGAGDRSLLKQPPGNLYVQMTLLPHERFVRMGQNLLCETTVDAFDALLGITVEVATIDGSTIRVTVPAGIQPGDKLRVPQKGMSTLGTTVRGDLYVTIKMSVPRELPAAVTERLRAIKTLLSTQNV